VLVALGIAGVLFLVLAFEAARPTLRGTWARARARRAGPAAPDFDPGRERRAEQRARELLRTCVSEREWEMYRDLGLISVAGTVGAEPAAYAYLIYPHRPIVAYVPQTRELLSEYCVAFRDDERPFGSGRLPDADDVLAKWLALAADERALVAKANMHLPGRQVDPAVVRADLARLAEWARARSLARGTVRAA